MSQVKKEEQDTDLLAELEGAVRRVLRNRKASKAELLSAINGGTKLLMVKHRINGSGDEKGFFE